MKKVELLAPAGNLEKLKAAFHYGADAVYAGGLKYSLRERSGNFSREELQEAVEYTHGLGKKIYAAVNIYAHNRDLEELPAYLSFLRDIEIDAIIVSDPGVLALTKEHAPGVEIHLSTQANTTNYASANYWKSQGVSRVVLARELAGRETSEIAEKSDIELEMFVHGAQCMAYSGRCLISDYLTDRGANQGDCAQSCRWNYSVVEQKRPGEYHEVEEDSRGVYFFNSRDLALLPHLEEVLQSGIDSIKIEGRVKSLHYVSTVVRAYRESLDAIYEGRFGGQLIEELYDELKKVSHRDYSTGFFLADKEGGPEDGKEDGGSKQSYDSSRPFQGLGFLGQVVEAEGSGAWVDVRGKFCLGDEVEVMRPRKSQDFTWRVDKIREGEGLVEHTRPNTKVWIDFGRPVSRYDILRHCPPGSSEDTSQSP